MGGSLFLQNCNLRERQTNRITAAGLIYCGCSKQWTIRGGYYDEEKSFAYSSCCFGRCDLHGPFGEL